jgi:predicted nucleotidyltransferase
MNEELENNLKTLESQRQFLREIYAVKNIGVFGSVAKNRQKSGSDIDILVELSSPMGFFRFLELEVFLKKLLKKRVDLVTRKALKPAIKREVLKTVIYAQN